MPPIPLLAPEYLESLPAPNTPLTPPTPPDALILPKWFPTPLGAPSAPWCPLYPFWFSIVVTLQMTIFMQLKCSFSIVIISNSHHFATDQLYAVKMLIFYHHHFQLLSPCNRPSSGVCPLYNIPSSGIKGTTAVLWSSANFSSISQNMHYKAQVASQQWKGNQVVLTWKNDWLPWRTSTYKRPFTQEGNYLVWSCNLKTLHT